MRYIKVDYYKTLVLSAMFCFAGFFSNAQYVKIGSCSTTIDKCIRMHYFTDSYKNLKGIVDTNYDRDRYCTSVHVIGSKSFQILVSHLSSYSRQDEEIDTRKWCGFVSYVDEDSKSTYFIYTNDYYEFGDFRKNVKDFLISSDMDKQDRQVIMDNFR